MKPGDTSRSEAASARTAPLKLWRVAQAFLATLYALFGAPEDVAARHTLTLKAHSFMAGWLRCAEALLRRLLVLEAAAYPKPNTRPLLKPRRTRPPKLMTFEADWPEDWRVSFRCFHCRGSGIGSRLSGFASAADNRSPKPDNRARFRSAWPLAERYEALLRVFNAPAAYARRLSARLHATPHRLVEPLAAPAEAVHRIDHFEAMAEQGRSHWRLHFSSG